MKRFFNELVKGRECLRPLVPSVMEEYADKWFDMSRWGGGGGGGGREARGEAGVVAKAKSAGTAKSLQMSLTAYTRDRKASLIPTVVHMDRLFRIQTVSKTAKSFYHSLIYRPFMPVPAYP